MTIRRGIKKEVGRVGQSDYRRQLEKAERTAQREIDAPHPESFLRGQRIALTVGRPGGWASCPLCGMAGQVGEWGAFSCGHCGYRNHEARPSTAEPTPEERYEEILRDAGLLDERDYYERILSTEGLAPLEDEEEDVVAPEIDEPTADATEML